MTGLSASNLLSGFDLSIDIDFSELGESIFPSTVFGTTWLTDSVVSGWIVVVIVLLAALVLRLTVIRKWKTVPTGPQMFLEWIVGFFDKSSEEMTDGFSKITGPYTLGAAAYICFGVLIEMVGFRPVMADISAGLALALCSFVLIQGLGFVRNKARRLKHFLNPINILTDVAVPFSMTFRLFGSILSGMVIMDLVYICVQEIWFLGVPIIIPSVLSILFTVFHAVIQAYVFALLTLTFIEEAIEPVPKKKKKKKKTERAQRVLNA